MKNPSSSNHISPNARISPTPEQAPDVFQASEATAPAAEPAQRDGRPSPPNREMSEREIVQMNTEINAGGASNRRNSSNPRGSVSRRQSGQANLGGDPSTASDEGGMRLKWDEANLYLNEGQMGGRMKIDEPKTPFAGHYDPTEDDNAETSALNAEELNVDELDLHKQKAATTQNGSSSSRSKDSDIPGLDIGEPEMDQVDPLDIDIDGEKRVLVDSEFMDVDGGRHGEEKVEEMSREEREKHKRFEEMRKKHYEMKNVKDLLGCVDVFLSTSSFMADIVLAILRISTTLRMMKREA